MSEYQVIARRYRPKTFKEVLGQDPIIKTLKNGLLANRLSSAYLFCGSRGTGKTTLARILAKALLCTNKGEDNEPCNSCRSCQEIAAGSSLDVLEIDGASHRGIDDIRIITESVGYAPANGKYKVYIIDEVHMLTKEAFNALLKTLEEPPEQVKFFFATTEPHKVPETILSRCQRFNLRRIPLQLIAKKLKMIGEETGAEVSPDALIHIAQYAEGGLRDAESMFDLLLAYSKKITLETVQEALGILPRKWLFEFDTAYASSQYVKVFEICEALYSEGKDIHFFLKDLIQHYRHLLYCKLSYFDDFAHENAEYIEEMKKASDIYSQEECLGIIDILTTAEQQIRTSISQRIFLEATLLKIMRLRSLIPIDRIAMRLMQLENALGTQQPEVQVSSATPRTPPKQEREVQKAETKQSNEAELSPKREILRTLKDEKPPTKPSTPVTTPVEKEPIAQTQSRIDTVMQFAAVELEGSLQKKQK